MTLTSRLSLGACLLVVLTVLLHARFGTNELYIAIPLAILFGIVAGRSLGGHLVDFRDSARALAERLPPRLPATNMPEIAAVAQAIRQTRPRTCRAIHRTPPREGRSNGDRRRDD